MSLNMVANQADQKAYARVKASLVELELSEDGKNVKNAQEWDEGVREGFAALGLEFFLFKESGLKVDASEVPGIIVDQRVEACKAARITSLAKKIKKEAGSGKKASDVAESKEDEELKRKVQEQVEKRKASMLASITAASALAEKKGARSVVYFADFMSGVDGDMKKHFPKNKYRVKVDGEELWCELEPIESRNARQTAWQLLVHSLSGKKGVHKSFWKHVPVNNVYELHKLIMSHFADNDRRNVVASLAERMRTFVKKENELFVAFVGRFRQLLNECVEAQLVFDPMLVHEYAVDAMMRSKDEKVKKVYADALMQHGEMTTHEEVFDKMMLSMKLHEKKERAVAMNDEEFEVKKKKDKKARKAARKARAAAATDSSDSSSSEDEKDYQAVARKAAVNRSESEDVRGVCFWHQVGKCNRGKECSFEHRKLSKEGQEKLKKMMKEKNEKGPGGKTNPVRCYTCEQEGHISTNCPKKNVTNKTMMSKATAGMTDEQVKLLAKEMHEIQMREAAKNQE
jgi:hypothetical protein